MQARGPLMIEHRLIERMLVIIQERLGEVEKTRKIDASFVDTAVDFVRSYADRTHHGKEEDIMFRVLNNKGLSEPDRRGSWLRPIPGIAMATPLPWTILSGVCAPWRISTPGISKKRIRFSFLPSERIFLKLRIRQCLPNSGSSTGK